MIVLPMPPQAPHLCHQHNDSSSDPSQLCDQVSSQSSTQPTPSTTPAMLSIVTPSLPGPNVNSQGRPKLSLQTGSLPITFGKSTTALSLSLNIPTSSPTVRNTFNNAYDLPRRGSPISPSNHATPSRTRPASRLMSPYTTHEQPYQLPLGVKGILRNTPIPALTRRTSLSAGGTTRRFFPPQKRVAYRYPLEEEIKTVRYVIPHSELSSDEDSKSDSDASIASSYNSSSGSSEEEEDEPQSSIKKRKTHSKRQVDAAGVRDIRSGPDDFPPSTPVQGRRKRRRQWRWTLGSLNEAQLEEQSPCTPKAMESEEHSTGDSDELPFCVNDIPLPPSTPTEAENLEASSPTVQLEVPAELPTPRSPRDGPELGITGGKELEKEATSTPAVLEEHDTPTVSRRHT